MTDLPSSARVVIVGGGIVGCSVAYHLGKLGWTDVVLLEQGQLTSGSTWHAAGLVGQLRTSANITQLLGYSVELYGRLEAETGQATGWKRNGGLQARLHARPLDRGPPPGHHRPLLRPGDAPAHAARGAGAVAADDRRGRGRCRVPAHRRPGQPLGHHPGAGQGRAHGGRDLARRRRGHRLRARAGPRPGRADLGRPDRLREGGAVRRAVDAGAGRPGRGQRAAGLRPAPVHRHRGDRRRHPRPADPARPRPAHLLQGGGRRPGHGRLRAQPQALGRARPARPVRVPAPGRGLGPFRADHGAGAGPRPGLGHGRRQAADQRPGELHARRQLDHRRGARDPRRLRRRRLQRLRHRLGRRGRDGLGRVGGQGRAALRRLAGRHPPLRPQPPGHGLGPHPHAGGLRQALRHGLAARGVPLPADPCAARRSGSGSRTRVRASARSWAGSGPTGSPGPARSPSTA